MSDFGAFDAIIDAENAPGRQQRTASMHLANAIDEVRDRYGDFLMTASGKDEFEDRWHYMKADVRKTVEAHIFPNSGTMNRVRQALKREFSATIGDDNAEDPTKKPKKKNGDGNATTINDKQYDKVKDGDTNVKDAVETNTGDGSDAEGHGASSTTGKQKDPRHSSRRYAEDFDGDLIPEDNFDGYLDSVDQGGPEKVQRNFEEGGDSGADRGRAAKRLALEMYSDWAESNGLRVAKLSSLEHYADTGIDDNTYHLLANYIRTAGDDCDCDDDDSSEKSDSDSSDGPPPPSHDEGESDSESDSSGDSDSEGGSDDSDSDSGAEDSGGDEAPSEGAGPPEFGGSDDPAGPPADDEGFAGPPEGPQGLEDEAPAGPPEDPAAGGDPAMDDGSGQFPDAAGPGDQFAIPDAPPELSPEEQGMIPEGDTSGDQSIPPELIDDILGLPPGTIEQLVVQEISGGGDVPPDAGPPPPEEDPAARLARKLFAEATGKDWYAKAPKGEPAAKPQTNWDSANGGVTKGVNAITPKSSPKTKAFADSIKSARRTAAEDDSSGGGGESSGGDPASGGQAVAPAPAQGVAPPASATQPGPDDGALLDQAAQAVTQLVDTKVQEFQQLIDPLQQAQQAIQFALQIEQAANPLDVTPPGGTVDVGPGAQQPGAAANTAAPAPAAPAAPQQQTAALQRHAFKIAYRHELSERGYHMLLAAMSNRHYRHIAEAIAPLQDPQEKMALASSVIDLFKADNPRFNPGAFLASAGIEQGITAANPADRAGDRWADGKDRASKESEDYDTDPDNWEEREARRLGLTASRHPFAEGSARTAGETLKPATGGNTMDVYEHEGQGVKPEFSDNNKLTDLPKLKGPKIGSGVVDKYQHFKQNQEKQGLGIGGDAEVESFFQTRGKGYGDIARGKVHQLEGIEPHPKAASRTAGFFQPKVAGWRWDDHQNAYMTEDRKPFRCTTAGCDTDVPTPGQTMCRCGRLWYTYAIGDQNHLASNSGQLFLAREIPVRPDVIMANRHLVADEEFNNASGEAPFQDYADDVEFFSDDELDNAPVAHAPGETDMGTTRSAASDYPDDHHVVTRDGEKFCSACDAMLWDPNVHHCPAKQASRRVADWTVYDDDDNAGYNEGPSGPPSTEAKPVRKDWAKVDGQGRYAPSTFK